MNPGMKPIYKEVTKVKGIRHQMKASSHRVQEEMQLVKVKLKHYQKQKAGNQLKAIFLLMVCQVIMLLRTE